MCLMYVQYMYVCMYVCMYVLYVFHNFNMNNFLYLCMYVYICIRNDIYVLNLV
jgi:hypothetical protein